MKYFKMLLFLMILALAVLLPLVTGTEVQSTEVIQEVGNPMESTWEKLEDQSPMPEPNFQEVFPKSITVLDVNETVPVNIRELPSTDSKSLGVVYGNLMHIDVVKHLDSGFSEVSTWDYNTMKDISGFVQTKYIKEIKLDEKYKVVVDLSEQKVHIYENDSIAKTFLCSTGLDKKDYGTPKGFYRIGERGDSFYSPKYKQGAYYWVRFNNNYLFHSVPFDENKELIEDEAAKLGQKASHGCIRLSMDDALWFYKNVPQGTPVVIRN